MVKFWRTLRILSLFTKTNINVKQVKLFYTRFLSDFLAYSLIWSKRKTHNFLTVGSNPVALKFSGKNSLTVKILVCDAEDNGSIPFFYLALP